MPITPARMPLLDHLGELRRRLTIVVVSVIATAIVIYFATPTLIEIMIDPIRSALPEGSELTILSALGGFTIRFKVAFFFGLIICTPIILWEAMGFFLPALKANERKWVVPTVAAMVVLFFIGMIFCYLVIQKAAFGWLLAQTDAFAEQVVDAEDFLDIMMKLEVGFGIAFKTFRSQWRYVYVGLLTLSACVTPDASPVTMIIMFAALIGLYEIALAIARVVITAKDGREALKWSREDYEAHEFAED